MRLVRFPWVLLGLMVACGSDESGMDERGVLGIGGKADYADQAIPVRFGTTITGTVGAQPAFFSIPLRAGDVVLTEVKPLGPGIKPKVHLVWESYWAKEGKHELDPEDLPYLNPFKYARDYDGNNPELSEGQRQFFVNHSRAIYRFRTLYYVKVTNEADQAGQFELTITCKDGPCFEDPDEKTITDYYEPNNTYDEVRCLWYPSASGQAWPILNLASAADQDWMYFPLEDESFELDETDYTYEVSLEDPDTGELVPGLRLSVWYVCDTGENTSICRDGSEKDTAPDGTRACKGDNRVTISPECSSWVNDSGEIHLRVKFDDPTAAGFTEYRPVIRYLPFSPKV